MVKVKKRMGTFIRTYIYIYVYVYKTCRVIMDRENNTHYAHIYVYMCVYVPTHTCARARGIVSKNGRAVPSPPHRRRRARSGGRVGRHSVRRRRSDEAPRMSECVSCPVYILLYRRSPCRCADATAAAATALPPVGSRQSPVSRQPSNTCVCACCSPRRTQLVASCVRY